MALRRVALLHYTMSNDIVSINMYVCMYVCPRACMHGMGGAGLGGAGMGWDGTGRDGMDGWMDK